MIIGTGVDIVDIARFRGVLDRLNERFIIRIFTDAEQQYCSKRGDPVPHYAVRFAAKEALFKALGTGWSKGVTWLDVEVQRDLEEAPLMRLNGEAARLSSAKGASRIHLSLSHSDHWALAMVILE